MDRLALFPDAPKSTVNILIDAFLTRQLNTGPVGLEKELDTYSRRLLENTDHRLTFLGTRGSVLIDLGRIEEGEAMLEDVLRRTDSTIDKSYANIFLSLAKKQKHDLVAAREFAKAAQKINPACPALVRISDLLD